MLLSTHGERFSALPCGGFIHHSINLEVMVILIGGGQRSEFFQRVELIAREENVATEQPPLV